MKITILTIILLGALIVPVAQSQDHTSLLSVASGPQFTVGSTVFRMVPGVSLQKNPKATDPLSVVAKPQTHALAATSSPNALGTIGPYEIVPTPPGAKRDAVSKTAIDANPQQMDVQALAVAVNTRSGQPVVVTPRLKVFADKANDIAAAAKQAGGTLIYASDTDGSGLIRFVSVDAAQAAVTAVSKMPGVRGVSIDVIEQFKQKL